MDRNCKRILVPSPQHVALPSPSSSLKRPPFFFLLAFVVRSLCVLQTLTFLQRPRADAEVPRGVRRGKEDLETERTTTAKDAIHQQLEVHTVTERLRNNKILQQQQQRYMKPKTEMSTAATAAAAPDGGPAALGLCIAAAAHNIRTHAASCVCSTDTHTQHLQHYFLPSLPFSLPPFSSFSPLLNLSGLMASAKATTTFNNNAAIAVLSIYTVLYIEEKLLKKGEREGELHFFDTSLREKNRLCTKSLWRLSTT